MASCNYFEEGSLAMHCLSSSCAVHANANALPSLLIRGSASAASRGGQLMLMLAQQENEEEATLQRAHCKYAKELCQL